MTTVISNQLVVTEAGATPEITLTTATLNVASAGGQLTIDGTTNLPDGSNMVLYLNGVSTGQSTTSAKGAFAFTYTIPADTSTVPIEYTFTVQSPS